MGKFLNSRDNRNTIRLNRAIPVVSSVLNPLILIQFELSRCLCIFYCAFSEVYTLLRAQNKGILTYVFYLAASAPLKITHLMASGKRIFLNLFFSLNVNQETFTWLGVELIVISGGNIVYRRGRIWYIFE